MRDPFEERYFPLKRGFLHRSKRYRRCRSLPVKRTREAGKLLTLTQITMPLPETLPAGKKLLFISDWHWHDSERNHRQLRELIEYTAKNPPDILLLGGDLCDDAEYLDSLPVLLKKLSAAAPAVVAVNGNWETGKRWLDEDYFFQLYRRYGITLLENDSITVDGFRIFGLPDISSVNFRYLNVPEKDETKTDILMTHSPDGVISADHDGFLRHFQLAFCGHTHGGQVRIPLIGAIYCPSFYSVKFVSGIFERRGLKMKMIVSSGIGEHAHTRRFCCPPEIVEVVFK